ncbi:hypothetical protein GGF37_003205 [Kickxella alabastrina]|nr:hypothetical protein GGF37_003205 [Kickxella alabastrina]
MALNALPILGTIIAGAVLLLRIFKYVKLCRLKLIADDHSDEKFAQRAVIDSRGNTCKNIKTVLETHCPLLTDPTAASMVPTPYLCGGMLQTAYCVNIALKSTPQSEITYDRESMIMSDKGTMSLDWYPERRPGAQCTRPIVILIPGVGGSSYEHHVRSMAKLLATGNKKYRVAAMNYRGSGRTPLTSSKINGAHDTDDFGDIVQHIIKSYPNTLLVALGFSLGANILTRYLGELKDKSPLAAAVALCCPFDMEIAGRSLDAKSFLNDNVFQPNLVASIKRSVERNADLIRSSDVGYDVDAVMQTKRMSEIDSLLIAKKCGFKNCWDYYRAASSTQYIQYIRTPYLAINALDDPVTPYRGIPLDMFSQNPFTALVLARHGGHLGFFSGITPKIWYLEPIKEYFDVFAFKRE